jgi:hypothetical protein
VKGIYDFPAVPQRGLSENNVVITRWDASSQKWTVVSKSRGAPF